MADLKKKPISIRGKYGPTQRGDTPRGVNPAASPYEKSPGLQKMRSESSPAKRRDMATSAGIHSRPTTAANQSPIDEVGEAAPGSEITPTQTPKTFADEDIRPDFEKSASSTVNDYQDLPQDDIATDNTGRQETTANATDGNETALNDAEESLRDTPKDEKGGFYKKLSGGQKSSTFAYLKKARIAIAGGVLVAGILGIYTAAPMFLIGYLGDIVINNPTSRLAAKSFGSYRTKKYASFTDRFSGDGRRTGKIISEMETGRVINGEYVKYQFEYDPLDSKKITSVTEIKPSGSRIIQNVDDEVAKVFGDFVDEAKPIASGSAFGRSFLWRNDFMEALERRHGVPRVSILRPETADEAADGLDDERTFNKRSYEAVQGNGDKTTITADTKLADDATEGEKSAAGAIDDVAASDGTLIQGTMDKLAAGEPVRLMDEADRAFAGASTGASPFLLRAIERFTSGRGVIGKVGTLVRSMFDVTDLPDALCTINKNIRIATQAARYYSDLKLILYGYMWVSSDDGIRDGVATSRFARELMHRVTIPDENGNTFASAPSFNFAQRGSFSKARNDESFGSIINTSGEPKGTIAAVSDKTDIPGCTVWKNPIAKVGINGAIAVGTVLSDGLIGGAFKASGEASALAIKTAFVEAVKGTFSREAFKQLPKGFVLGAIGGISIEGIGMIAKIQAEKQLYMAIHAQEQGGVAGQLLGGSSESINESATLLRGYTPATVEEYSAAAKEFAMAEHEEMKNRSVFDRYFNVYAQNSLANQAAVTVAMGAGADIGTGLRNTTSTLARLPSFTPRIISSLFVPLTSAAGTDTEVAFDTYTTKGDFATKLAVTPTGSLLPLLKFTDKFDPLENKAYLINEGHIDATTGEPKSDTFKAHMENCVEGLDILSPIEESGSSESPDKDCLAKLELTQRFKAYLAWRFANGAEDNAYFPEEVGQEDTTTNNFTSPDTTGPTAAPINAEGLNGYTIPCQGLQAAVKRVGADSADWSGIKDSGTIGSDSTNQPIKVYIRDACPGQQNVRTIVLVNSVHGSENAGQLVSHELLFNQSLPPDVRIIAIPEYCSCAGTGSRGNANGVDLNRNNAFNWGSLPQNQTFETGLTWSKGDSAGSEPETKALNKFLLSVGRANVSIHYHDSLNYVVGSSQDGVPLAAQYATAGGFRNYTDEGRRLVPQRGSVDGWYNQETGTPTILVEMGPVTYSQDYINKHVAGVLAVINGGTL